MIARRLSWLTGLILLLGVVLAVEWLWPREAPPPLGPTAHLARPARGVSVAARETGGWAGVILARPVFSISRRPPKVVVSSGRQTAPGEARLAGIMITGLGRRAIFAPEGGGHALVLAEGAQVNQGTIRSILPDRVVMASGTVLRPSYDRNRALGQNTTVPYQPPTPPVFGNPGLPGFPNQAFPTQPGIMGNPSFTPPGFPAFQPGVGPPGAVSPGFVPPGFVQPGPAQQVQGGDEGLPASPQNAQPPPGFRGTIIPPRRE